jgi:hypothetical protein
MICEEVVVRVVVEMFGEEFAEKGRFSYGGYSVRSI